MRIIRSQQLKLFGILILVVITAFGHKCSDNKDYVDQTEPAGQGSGDYDISMASIPDVFDCNSNSILQVWIDPNIDQSYQGFNRVFFTLDGGGRVYRSNYVDFYSNNTDAQMVEFGGSIPDGCYSPTVYIGNIQENCANDSNIYARYNMILHDLQVTSCGTPQKTMNIEYGYQTSDTSAVYTYDLFQSPNLSEYINIAFNPGNTTYIIIPGITGMDAELVSSIPQKFAEYIEGNKMYINIMYLCGIKGFKDGAGNPMPTRMGMTLMDGDTFLPNEWSGSLVAFHTCMTLAASRLGADYNDYINKVTIHELGHQRAFESHYGHASEFCVMNQGVETQYGSITMGRTWNPMFCQYCIDSLKNVSW